MSFLTERQKQHWTLPSGAQRISKLFAARGSSPHLFASTLYLFTEVASSIKVTLNPVGSCRRSFWTFTISGCNSLRLHAASRGWPHRFGLRSGGTLPQKSWRRQDHEVHAGGPQGLTGGCWCTQRRPRPELPPPAPKACPGKGLAPAPCPFCFLAPLSSAEPVFKREGNKSTLQNNGSLRRPPPSVGSAQHAEPVSSVPRASCQLRFGPSPEKPRKRPRVHPGFRRARASPRAGRRPPSRRGLRSTAAGLSAAPRPSPRPPASAPGPRRSRLAPAQGVAGGEWPALRVGQCFSRSSQSLPVFPKLIWHLQMHFNNGTYSD